jgi:methylmalonyl-CoA/ethylmalonyl-CoA epimerase
MGTISHIDHVAIVVKSINEARAFYEDALGLKISHIEEMPRRGIKTAFLSIGEVKIELIEPINEQSEVANFLAKRGPGLHHIAFKTSDIKAMETKLSRNNARLTYDSAQPGAHGTRVNFIHPQSTGGTLLELVE